MITAVFDTNVVVSGMLSPHGPPGIIVDRLRSGALRAVLDDRIFDEYREVLLRPRLRLPKAEVRIVLDAIRTHAHYVDIPADLDTTGYSDPDDALFLACARVAGVCFVTGNLRHYPKRLAGSVQVLTPTDYLAQTRKH